VSKDQVVLLVSRVIAAFQCISAMLEITYLPERFMSLHHYRGSNTWLGPSYLTSIQSLELSMLCFRIAGLLILAWVFWQCGPWISKLLLPEEKNVVAEDDSIAG